MLEWLGYNGGGNFSDRRYDQAVTEGQLLTWQHVVYWKSTCYIFSLHFALVLRTHNINNGQHHLLPHISLLWGGRPPLVQAGEKASQERNKAASASLAPSGGGVFVLCCKFIKSVGAIWFLANQVKIPTWLGKLPGQSVDDSTISSMSYLDQEGKWEEIDKGKACHTCPRVCFSLGLMLVQWICLYVKDNRDLCVSLFPF